MRRSAPILRLLRALAFIALVLPALGAAAPTTAPASIESTPIRRAAPAGGQAGEATKPSDPYGLWRIGWALAIVIGLILLLRWGGRKLLGLPTMASGTPAVRIVGRTLISPRQQVLLLHVGRRIVVVANTGPQVNTLCQITSADEVASILAQANQRSSAAPAGLFGSVFTQASAQFDAGGEQAPAAGSAPAAGADEAEVAATRAQVRGLLEKVRSLSQGFKRTRDAS